MSEMDREIERRIAADHLRNLESFEHFARDQAATQARWLNASLLAINSAGILTVLQTSAASHGDSALFAFAAGVAATLLSGLVRGDALRLESPQEVRTGRRYWTEVALSGERDAERETAISAEIDRATWRDYAAPGLGWASGILWGAGAFLLTL